jgi:hypothetical protein
MPQLDYIPGAAQHAIITDQCRQNKGDAAVIEEACQRIRDAWNNGVSKGWPIGSGARFHVALIVERPELTNGEGQR